MNTINPLELGNVTALDMPQADKDLSKTINSSFQPTVTAEALADELDISMAIGTDDVIEGKISIGSNKSLAIRGTVKGDIECGGRVIVLPGGKVLGSIKAAALWVEGEIGAPKNPAKVDVGDLHLGVNSYLIGDCIYDTMGVAMPNRGVRGQMIPRSEVDVANV